MLKSIIEAISSLTPFLDQYPVWVKLLFSVWFILSSSLFLALVLARNPKDKNTGEAANPTTSPKTNNSPDASPSPDISPTPSPKPTPTPTPTQIVRLKIRGVELYGQLGSVDDVEVQVTAVVNGTEYKYPSLEGIRWAKVGPEMSPQQFRLPVSQSGYEVRFTMLARQGSEQISFVSQNTESIDSLRSLPFEGTYNFYRKVRGSRRANIEASVKYEITMSSNR